MGVDVYLLKDYIPSHKEFIDMAKKIESEDENLKGLTEAINMFINLNGETDWLMQFGTSYLCWLHWIVTASDGDPSRVGMCEVAPNTRFVRLIPEGHPWTAEREDDPRCGIIISIDDCKVLLEDINWFITEKMPSIVHCDYLKTKTNLFKEAFEKVIEANAKMLIG
jgi:hypothetical protein